MYPAQPRGSSCPEGDSAAKANAASSSDAAIVVMLYGSCDQPVPVAELSAENSTTVKASAGANAVRFGLSASEAVHLQKSGMSAEDMFTLSALANASGRTAAELETLHASGKSWDQIAANLGLKLPARVLARKGQSRMWSVGSPACRP